MADEPELIAVHTRTGNDYLAWVHTAQILFAARNILADEQERARAKVRAGQKYSIGLLITWTVPMLAAFGIECLIKAIWVKQGHALARNGKYVPMCKNERHDLVRLCGVAGIALDATEQDALRRISRIAHAIGRYPIARSVEDHSGYSWGTNDDRLIAVFVARLQTELTQTNS